MQLTASYVWPDGSSIDVIIDDQIDGFDPCRNADLKALAVDMLDKAVAKIDARDHAEHKAE